jgi:acylphosphatase
MRATPAGDDPRHWTIRVTGHVQGVFFRRGAREMATALGLAGSAENEPDGSVLIEVEGPPAALERFRAWCAVGTERARVDRVEVTEGPARGLRGFQTG